MSVSPFKFTDALDREWVIEISTYTIKRLKTELNFSFDDLFAEPDQEQPKKTVAKYQSFLNDDAKFSDVLFVVLKDEAEKRGVSQQDFDKGLRGQANVAAIRAFHAAYTDFSRAPRTTFLRGVTIVAEKEEKLQRIAEKRMTKEAEKLTDEKIEQMVEKGINEAFSKHATDTAGILV